MLQCYIRMIGGERLFPGQPDEVVREQMAAALRKATKYGVRRVKKRTPQAVMGAAGGLLGSIQAEERRSAGNIVGLISTASPYGLVIEKGRLPRKGMPPKGALQRWVEKKMGLSVEEAKKAEYPVRRKIAQKGFAGAEMFQKTLDEDWSDFMAIFERHGMRIAKGMVR